MKTLEITQADIDNARHPDASTCPVAIALSRATGRIYEVTDEWIYDVANNHLYEDISQGIKERALAWDRRQPVRTGTVRLPKGIVARRKKRQANGTSG